LEENSYILMVVEGKKTEPHIINNLTKYFFQDNTIIYTIYGTVIYSLYSKILLDGEIDEDLDFIQILKEYTDLPNKIIRDNVSEIYLFFDHDGHTSNASSTKLIKMLEYFDNETQNGKLYVSYPMVEATKHIGRYTYINRVAKISENKKYKNRVSNESYYKYRHFPKYNKKIWYELVKHHSKKIGYLTSVKFRHTFRYISQKSIYNYQYKRYIKRRDEVLIMGAFPIFLLDYFGYKYFFSKDVK